MHINKLFRQTSQLKPNIFHKFYHFPNARNSFIRSVPYFIPTQSSRANSPRGTKVPGSELARVLLADSLQGANWPGSEKAVNHFPSPARNGLGMGKKSQAQC